jgi:hypothetical protein
VGFLLRIIWFVDIYTDMAYRFQEFEWLKDRDGFNYPVDVFEGSVYLGTLVCLNDGYHIDIVFTPHSKSRILKTDSNKFKTKEEAAKMLHWVWKKKRNE